MQQLLYGSADKIEDRPAGGWGVIRESDGMSERSRQALTGLASVQLATTMPQFPSSEQLASRPRRFRSQPGPQGTCYVAMSCEAGSDHTGRPGNVVTHAAVVPTPDTTRSAEWFFANNWVLPFGAREVSKAGLPPELTTSPGWSATSQWLSSDPARLARARWAASKAVEKIFASTPVLFVCTTLAEGAHLIALVQWLFSAGYIGQFGVRIGEDAQSLATLQKGMPYLVAVTPEVQIPQQLHGWVVDVTGPMTDGADWAADFAELLTQPAEVAVPVFSSRDELYFRAHSALKNESFTSQQALTVAWFSRDDAQITGQEQVIERLLSGIGPTASLWPEVQQIAASLSSSGPTEQEVQPVVNDEGLYSQAETLPSPSPYAEELASPYDQDPAALYASAVPDYDPSSLSYATQDPEIKLPYPASSLGLDAALEASARLGSKYGSLQPLQNDDWLNQLPNLDPATRGDIWAVAAVAGWVTPKPEIFSAGLTQADAPFSSAVQAVWERTQQRFGAHPELEETWKGKLWP